MATTGTYEVTAFVDLYNKATGIYEISTTMEVFEVTYPADDVFFWVC